MVSLGEMGRAATSSRERQKVHYSRFYWYRAPKSCYCPGPNVQRSVVSGKLCSFLNLYSSPSYLKASVVD